MRGACALAAAWLACGAVPVSARGASNAGVEPPACPYPGSGMVHVYGEVESVTVVRNPVKHASKAFLAVPRKADVWDEKHVLRLRIDSARGGEELGGPLVQYPGDYLPAVYGLSPFLAPDFGRLLGRDGLFRFKKRGEELILERHWTWRDMNSGRKVCWESSPESDSLATE